MLGDFIELSGPVSFSAHVNKRPDGTHALALVMGDVHFSTTGICHYKPGSLTPQELAERIIAGMAPFCVDVFLEDVFKRDYDVDVAEPLASFNQYWTKYIQGKRKGLPARYGLTPPKEHVRVHATDFRQTGLVASFDGFFNEAIALRDYYNKLNDPGTPNKMTLWKELRDYMQAATTDGLDLEQVLTRDVLNAPRMQKQLASTPPIFQKIAKNYLQTSVDSLNAGTEVFVKENKLEGKDNRALGYDAFGSNIMPPDFTISPSLEFAIIYNTLSFLLERKAGLAQLEQDILPYLQKLIDNMFEASVPVMDVYTMSRILRKYDVTKRRPQGEGCPTTPYVQVSIIYVGDSHARNYRDWFSELGWMEFVPLIRGVIPNERCLPIRFAQKAVLENNLALIKREQGGQKGEEKVEQEEKVNKEKEQTKAEDPWRDKIVVDLQRFLAGNVKSAKLRDFKKVNWEDLYDRMKLNVFNSRALQEPLPLVAKSSKRLLEIGRFPVYDSLEHDVLERLALKPKEQNNLPYALLYYVLFLQRLYNYLTYYDRFPVDEKEEEEAVLKNHLITLGEALAVNNPLEDDPLQDVPAVRESPDLIVDAAR